MGIGFEGAFGYWKSCLGIASIEKSVGAMRGERFQSEIIYINAIKIKW